MSNENGIAAIQYIASDNPGVCRIRAISGIHTIQFTVTIRQNSSLPELNKLIISDVYDDIQENDQLNPLNVILSGTDADLDAIHFEVEQVGAAYLPEELKDSLFAAENLEVIAAEDYSGTTDNLREEVKSGAITAGEGERVPLEIGTTWAAELWDPLPQLLALVLLALFIAYFARQCRREQ